MQEQWKRYAKLVKYKANERAWVMRLLARLSPEERAEYERRMRETPGHHRTGKKYDSLKARVAEEVMYNMRVRK